MPKLKKIKGWLRSESGPFIRVVACEMLPCLTYPKGGWHLKLLATGRSVLVYVGLPSHVSPLDLYLAMQIEARRQGFTLLLEGLNEAPDPRDVLTSKEVQDVLPSIQGQ